MTERTFRAASPGRSSPAEIAPPVPQVPKNLTQGGNGSRRASSLEPTNRGGSPTPRGGGRGVSLDRGSHGPSGRGQRPVSNLSHVQEEDPGRSSVNFSRPMSPGATTQTASPQSHGWFAGPVVNQEAIQRMASTSRPKTSSGVTSYDLRNAQQSVQNAADRPVKTHQVARGAEGYRLASGSMRAKPSGTAVQSRSATNPPWAPRVVDPNSPDAVYDPSSRTFIHKQDAMARHRQLHEESEQQSSHYNPVPFTPVTGVVQRDTSRHSASPAPQYTQRDVAHTQQPNQVVLPKLDTSTKQERSAESQPPPYISEAESQPRLDRQTSEDLAGEDIRSPEHTNTDELPDHFPDVSAPAVSSPKFAPNQDSSYPRLGTPVIATDTNTVAGQGRGSIRTTQERQASLSPPRNAHFAPVATELSGVKHQPPPRSISPAKSALKVSPSVSRRGSSPITQNGYLQSEVQTKRTPSETSDAASDDGSKKRKNFRVSFEDTPAIAGTSAYVEAETPTTPSGLGASRWSPAAVEPTDEFEDFMKPRSALPSFSSIRAKERRPSEDDVAEKVTETVSSTPMTASVGSIAEPLESSNDHVVGGILAQDFAKKHAASNDPLPPEVTSVEGTGYVSDTSSEEIVLEKHGEEEGVPETLSEPEPKSLTTPMDGKPSTPAHITEQVIQVPAISLLPATPSPRERSEPIFQSLSIPGGWDDDVVERTETTVPSTEPATNVASSDPHIQFADEETDDNSSIYSDAYEDLSDAEDGFGSIDALMESPVMPSRSGLMNSKYASATATVPTSSRANNIVSANDDSDSDVTPTQDWKATEKHWGALTAASKKEPAPQSVITESVNASAPKPARVQPKATTSSAPSTPVKAAPTASQTTRSSAGKPLKSALKKTAVQPIPAAEPQMRQSMRGANRTIPVTAPEPQMRKTLRGGPDVSRPDPTMRTSMRAPVEVTGQPQMRKSMRAAEPSAGGSGLAASRHSMTPMDTKPPRGALQKRNIPAAAVVAKPRPQSMPATRRAPAPVPMYESDSDASASSFQRERSRKRASQGGRYTMRASMRQEAAPTMRATAPAPKQVRAISPPGSPPATLRKSLRPSSPTPERVKSSRFSIRSLSPMGRFRNKPDADDAPPSPTLPKKMPAFSKQPKPPKPAKTAKPKSVSTAVAAPFKSRFADSSDEDDDAPPRVFKSRFADSDDDEPIDYKLPPGLAPVRGIPRKAGAEDGDSTDLEEEEEEQQDVRKPNTETNTKASQSSKSISNGTNGMHNGEGSALSSGSLRDSRHAVLPSFEMGPKAKTKRGFFGLGRKKTVNSPAKTVSLNSAPDDLPLPPTQRNRDNAAPLTTIDEDNDIGSALQDSPVAKTKSPKLQRRSTPDWPLPPPPIIGTDDRPVSSDGVAARRPRFQDRQHSLLSNATEPVTDGQGRQVAFGRDGKKKKFQGLRRAFGLHD